MALFGKRKKETERPLGAQENENAPVKVLGSGCAKCNALEEAARAALGELGLPQEVGHVRDFSKIAAYGVMATPALVVDEKVVAAGKALTAREVKELIKAARGL